MACRGEFGNAIVPGRSKHPAEIGSGGRRGGAQRVGAGVQHLDASPDLASLIRLCAGGSRAAFRRLYDMQAARLHGIALRITRQPALAADAVHDALLQAWQNAARFEPERGSAESWLVSLVRYRALDIVRRRAREVPGDAMPELADSDPDPLANLVATAEGAALRRCLEALEEERRRLILLAFFDGLSHSELAAKCGLPLGTVKSWIRRALAALRNCLDA